MSTAPSPICRLAGALCVLALWSGVFGSGRVTGQEQPSVEDRLRSLEEQLAAFGDEREKAAANARQDELGPEALRGIYQKPFLGSGWRSAYFGGYTELEYHSFEDGIQGIPEGFRMHRTNLFLFTDLSDSIRFGSEFEFETEFDGASNSSDIEMAVEMAFVDWTVYQELTIRGGAILAPLGRINVNHDGPVRELTERPLVSTYVIPTTLTEAGIGALGQFEISRDFTLSYEAYVVNGFSVLDANGELAAPVTRQEVVLREARNSNGGDINDGVATTGRIGGALGQFLDVGASWHFGTYDERGDNFLSIFAGDFAAVWNAVTLEGEIAVADFARDAFARNAGVPDVFWGYYLQASYGGMPESLARSWPNFFGGSGARAAVILRYDWVDLDGDRGAIIEPGVSFRPGWDTVFKFSYRVPLNSFGLRGVPGTETYDDEGFVFSLTSYF
ncbi:MAG: hypothetical protein AAF517_08450 [Planctomycetota bacterium]